MSNRTKFTTIYHEPRLKLGLTCNEYCLMDTIYHLSNKKRSAVPGWCYAKKQTLADMLGVSRRSIISLINKLEKLNLIVCSDDRRHLQPTDRWETEVIDYNYNCEESSQGVKKVHSKCEESSQPSNKDNNKQTKKAKELAQIIEKNTKRLIVFCNNDKEQLKSMVERALFKGDPLEQIPAFVEHNCDNFMFRSSPESFFIRKFTQWLRYAKGFNRKKRSSAAPAAYNDILGEYYEKELDPKYLKRAPERYKGFATEYTDKVVRMDVDRLYGSLSSKNKTYTPYFIYDVCYGSLAAKAGTRPDRRFSKFKQWYEKLTDYRKNQDNLRQQFQKHLSK